MLPALGFTSDILTTFCRKPLFGYKAMVGAMLAISGLSFIVWGHHMFVSGMSPYLGMAFAVGTILIAVPSAVKVFNWLATLWRSRIRYKTPMLWAMGVVSLFISGGLSGIWLGQSAPDIHLHDTFFVVAHFHLIMAGAALFGVFGATAILVPEDVRAHDERAAGQVALLAHVHHLLRDVLPDALHRPRRPHAAHLRPVPIRVPEAAAGPQRVHHHQRDHPRASPRSCSS